MSDSLHPTTVEGIPELPVEEKYLESLGCAMLGEACKNLENDVQVKKPFDVMVPAANPILVHTG